jgi:hypothetical protein
MPEWSDLNVLMSILLGYALPGNELRYNTASTPSGTASGAARFHGEGGLPMPERHAIALKTDAKMLANDPEWAVLTLALSGSDGEPLETEPARRVR